MTIIKKIYQYINTHKNYIVEAILNSYAQVFFSKNKILALTLFATSMLQPFMGITGFTAIILINFLAYYWGGYNKDTIKDGLFGFNAFFLGMALAYDYQFNTAFCIVFVIFLLLIFLFVAFFINFFGTFKIPYISSLPFVFIYAFAHLILPYFNQMHLQEDKIYIINYHAAHSHQLLYKITHCLDTINLPLWLTNYAKTLSLIVFNESVFIGLSIALALLFFSRIIFSLSLIGFLLPHFWHHYIGLNETIINMPILHLNYILVAIAIGGFYVVPNKYSYLAACLATPLVLVIYLATTIFFSAFQVNPFTFSSSLTIILFLSFLKMREGHQYLFFPYIQYFSPEKTIYKYINSVHRFRFANYLKINLPFWGKWQVSQGYNGTITHLGEWSKALDFVVINEEQKTYKNDGLYLEDFYTFNKPVLAPLEGKVHTIINDVNDNNIGEINTQQNWGNTIIIEHAPNFYSQISHIKKDSFKVNIGDYVAKGTIVAMCGNSGRSPEPHIHFQLQTEAKVGAKPIAYPIAYFIEEKNGQHRFCMSQVPQENTLITNIEPAPLLNQALNFKPGDTISFQNIDDDTDKIEWQVFSDAYNRTYIYCTKTNATLWFHKDDVLFYAYDYEGSKQTLLFDFYLALYKVLLSCQFSLSIQDTYPLNHFNKKGVLIIQDFLAPFYRFSNARYNALISYVDNIHSPQHITLTTNMQLTVFKQLVTKKTFNIEFKNQQICSFVIHLPNRKKTYHLCH